MNLELMKKLILIIGLVLSSVVVEAQASFVPFPKAKDKYWRKQVPAGMRKDYIHLGDSCLDKSWEAIPDELFAEFRTNGNRTNYEAASFGIRRQFACLVMAEIMQHKGKFLPAIRKGLHYFMEKEPWWGIPAHYPKAKPERDIQPVDLFNAETASMLAWTLYMLEDEIDKQEKGLSNAVKTEIERRFLNPTLYEKQGWKYNANNWNTWITSNWLETALICEQDTAKLSQAMEGVKQDLRLFLKGYPDDGACEEGVAYWDRAGASFFESLYFLDKADVALPLSEKEKEKVHRMGSFLPTMHIHDLHFVNYSDAAAVCIPNINILFPFGAYEKDEKMMQLAAYTGQKYDYLRKPSTLFLLSGNYPVLGRELMLLSMLPQYCGTPAEQPRTEDAFLAESQILVTSNADWFVSMKGGHNAESHNHNDIGNFVIYYQNQPVVIDLGRDTYTSKSFSNERFTLLNCRSAYHNVPIINGYEQKDGKQYRAVNAEHISGDAGKGLLSVTGLDIEKAYPAEAQVKKWQRTMTLDGIHNQVEVRDSFDYEPSAASTELILMTCGEPRLAADGSVLLADGKVRLSVPKALFATSWEKVEMPEGIMKEQWHDNVYRLHVKFGEYAHEGSIRYVFSRYSSLTHIARGSLWYPLQCGLNYAKGNRLL